MSELLALCFAATQNAIPEAPMDRDAFKAVRAARVDGADPNEEADGGWRLLHCAVMGGQPALVELLLEHGARNEGRLFGQDAGTPLTLGLFYAKADLCRQYLADPPDPDDLRRSTHNLPSATRREPHVRF